MSKILVSWGLALAAIEIERLREGFEVGKLESWQEKPCRNAGFARSKRAAKRRGRAR